MKNSFIVILLTVVFLTPQAYAQSSNALDLERDLCYVIESHPQWESAQIITYMHSLGYSGRYAVTNTNIEQARLSVQRITTPQPEYNAPPELAQDRVPTVGCPITITPSAAQAIRAFVMDQPNSTTAQVSRHLRSLGYETVFYNEHDYVDQVLAAARMQKPLPFFGDRVYVGNK